MKTALCCVLLLAAVLGVALGGDSCRDASWANHGIAALATVDLTRPTTEAGRSAVVKALATAWYSHSGRYSPFLYVGYSNDDFYMINSCVANTVSAPPVCSGNMQIIVTVVNYDVFGDYKRRAFSVDGQGNVNWNNLLGTEQEYYATERPWYNITGWTDPYAFAPPATYQGQTLVSHSSGYTLGADRIYSEPCGPCLTQSHAVAPTFHLSQINLASWKAMTTVNQVKEALVKFQKDIFMSFPSKTLFQLLVAFDNGDSLLLAKCANDPTADSSCKSWKGDVVSQTVFGDMGRRTFMLNDKGVFESGQPSVGPVYDARTRPWYKTGDGWTDEYTFFDSSFVGRTFTKPILGGVVGGEANLNAQCDQCQDMYPCSNGASTEINFLFSGMISPPSS